MSAHQMEAPSVPIEATPDNAIVWQRDRLYLLDQRRLPQETVYLGLDSAADVARAIRDMVVRGAPAIGISAAYGVALGAARRFAQAGGDWKTALTPDLERLAAARPTAVNLRWALQRMRNLIDDLPAGLSPVGPLLQEAQLIHREDREANQRIGEYGADLIGAATAVITHCNAGALATGGYGTALGVIRSAHSRGMVQRVFADETRPWLQGARLTAWELQRDGIPVTLLADAAAASLMARGGIGWVIVGSDRIAANGDVANKIGTYGLAVAARHHGIGFMVAAPTSTIDLQVASGAEIPIEERNADELLSCGGRTLGAPGVGAWNPVFDITPAALVDVIVTEKGVVRSPNREKLQLHMASVPQSA